jgi:ribosomal protein L11 methylase PrmA
MEPLIIIGIVISAIIITYYLLFYGLIYGAEYQRINTKRLKKLIELGNLNPNKTVLDLGAGFGRIMFKAAESGANVIGYEIDPVKVIWIQNQIQKKLAFSHQTNITIIKDNLLNAELRQADVVYCYLFGPLMQKLGDKAGQEMKPGALLISAEHKINKWKPIFADNPNKIYVYKIGESNVELAEAKSVVT